MGSWGIGFPNVTFGMRWSLPQRELIQPFQPCIFLAYREAIEDKTMVMFVQWTPHDSKGSSVGATRASLENSMTHLPSLGNTKVPGFLTGCLPGLPHICLSDCVHRPA